MASKQGTEVFGGSVEVATAQTAVQLTTESFKKPAVGVWVGADSGNAGKVVVVGHSKAGTNAKLKEQKGLTLHEFDKAFIEIDDPSKLFVDVETSKDKVTFLVVLA